MASAFPWITSRRLSAAVALAALAVLAVCLTAAPAWAQSTLVTGLGGPAGFGTNVLPSNDDGSSAAVALAPYNLSGLCFFGRTHTQIFINNNGNVTYDAALPTYTPTAFPASTNPMMAPWWADVDTRGTATAPENSVFWDIRDGQLVVTWYRVGYYNAHADHRDTFQLVIRRVSGSMDYDVEYRYNQLTWTTGDASGGAGGLGGTPAQAGFDAGDHVNFSTLPGSRTASVLNLLTTSNTTPGVPGLWRYHFRGCQLQCLSNADCGGPTPICDTGTHLCRGCTADADCGGSTPFCATAGTNAGRCVQCLANGNCPTDRCVSNACVCASNADCHGGTPICDTGTRQCRACDAGSATDCTGSTPVCGPGGGCVQCAPGLTSACRAPTPVCNTTTFACVACLSTADCPTATPYCVAATGCTAGRIAITSPAAGSTAASRTPTISGTATPGQAITVVVDGMTLTTTSDPTTGAWSVTPASPLPAGSTTATATLSPAGGAAPTAMATFNVPCSTGSDCAAPTPFCDATTHLCRGCATNADCGGATPVCGAGGLCVLCTAGAGGMASACAMAPAGTACIQPATGSPFCGCATDTDCGGSTSGRVCDATTRLCLSGCSPAPTRNHCPAGLFCTSTDTTGATVGMCTTTCNTDSDCATAMPTHPHCLVATGMGGMNACVECTTDPQCAGRTDGRTRCIGAMNTCAQCTATDHAACAATGAGSACLATGLCGCTADTDCGADRMCATATGTCVARVAPDAGTDAGPLDSGVMDAGADATVTDTGAATDVSADAGSQDAGPHDAGRRDAGHDAGAATDAGEDGGSATDTGVPGDGADAGTVYKITGDGACACTVPGGGTQGPSALVCVGMALAAIRRRRRAA